MATAEPEVTFTIEPQGPFSLKESALFGFGQRQDETWDGVMRMAFCLDGSWDQVGVVLRQDEAGVHGTARGSGDAAAVRDQVARVLSLDHDAAPYVAVGERDPVVRRLLDAAPGLRPPLFYSPYEAAVWVVLSARRPRAQMSAVRQAMSEAHGKVFDLAGERHAALPTPQQLREIDEVPGLNAEKVARMHGVADAALDGLLDIGRIQALGPDAALSELQELRGIGKFYASLIVIRASGFTDVLPTDEPHLGELVARLYGLPAVPSAAQLEELAQPWRPMRTWVSVLVRAAGPRLLDA